MGTWEDRMTPRLKRQPQMERIETCWQMVGPSGKVLACAVYRVEAGLEVRCGYSEEDLLRSQRAADIGTARELAEEWRQAVLAKGGFTDLAPETAMTTKELD